MPALSQCYGASSTATPDFKNFFPRRHCQLVDPAQNDLLAFSINGTIDEGFIINISPLAYVLLKMSIDKLLLYSAARNFPGNFFGTYERHVFDFTAN